MVLPSTVLFLNFFFDLKIFKQFDFYFPLSQMMITKFLTKENKKIDLFKNFKPKKN